MGGSAVQYSLLVFEIYFTAPVISLVSLIREWVGGWEGEGVCGVGGQTKGGPYLPLCHRQRCCVLVGTGMYTNYGIDQDSHWQQSGTQPILISAPQWPNRTCNALTQFYRVGKKPSVKAYLAIYSHVVDASVTFWSVFVNPVTNILYMYQVLTLLIIYVCDIAGIINNFNICTYNIFANTFISSTCT